MRQPDIETSVDGKIPEEKFPRTLPLRHLVHEAQDFDSVLTPSFVGFYGCLLSFAPDCSEEDECDVPGSLEPRRGGMTA